MADFGPHSIFLSGLIDLQSPFLKLYLFKKSIEQELVKEIQINSFLQRLCEEKQVSKFKMEHSTDHFHQEPITLSPGVNYVKKDRRKKLVKKMKNDTKNIPKNFGKAIITFVEQKEELIQRLLAQENVSYDKFYSALRDKKRGINSIADLRNMWLDQHFIYARQMRIVSLYFLKRGSLGYVFGSRIANHEGHIKYRTRLIEVLRHPEEFTSIKTG